MELFQRKHWGETLQRKHWGETFQMKHWAKHNSDRLVERIVQASPRASNIQREVNWTDLKLEQFAVSEIFGNFTQLSCIGEISEYFTAELYSEVFRDWIFDSSEYPTAELYPRLSWIFYSWTVSQIFMNFQQLNCIKSSKFSRCDYPEVYDTFLRLNCVRGSREF